MGLHFIKMSSKTPVKILGYFIRTMFLTPKSPWPTFACQNLGTFKEYKDIGLTSYRNLRFSTFQNLGYFIRTMFIDAKNPWPILLVKILGFLKRTKILGLHFFKMSSKTPVKILGYFLRTRCLTPKTQCLYGLSKSWDFFFFFFFFKENRDFGPTLYENFR